MPAPPPESLPAIVMVTGFVTGAGRLVGVMVVGTTLANKSVVVAGVGG